MYTSFSAVPSKGAETPTEVRPKSCYKGKKNMLTLKIYCVVHLTTVKAIWSHQQDQSEGFALFDQTNKP